jgi:hypothetical protein
LRGRAARACFWRACHVLVGAGLACAAPETPPAAPPTVAAEPAAARLDDDFGLVEATGQGILMTLPDADAWRRDARETRTWVARHTATHSRLLVRTFRADGVARGEDCERQLRLWRRDLPVLPADARAETRRLRLAGDFAGDLLTAAEGPAHAVTGHALLFASDGRQCLCLVFSTSAEGASAASIVGARLASVARVSFERARRIPIEADVRAPGRCGARSSWFSGNRARAA